MPNLQNEIRSFVERINQAVSQLCKQNRSLELMLINCSKINVVERRHLLKLIFAQKNEEISLICYLKCEKTTFLIPLPDYQENKFAKYAITVIINEQNFSIITKKIRNEPFFQNVREILKSVLEKSNYIYREPHQKTEKNSDLPAVKKVVKKLKKNERKYSDVDEVPDNFSLGVIDHSPKESSF